MGLDPTWFLDAAVLKAMASGPGAQVMETLVLQRLPSEEAPRTMKEVLDSLGELMTSTVAAMNTGARARVSSVRGLIAEMSCGNSPGAKDLNASSYMRTVAARLPLFLRGPAPAPEPNDEAEGGVGFESVGEQRLRDLFVQARGRDAAGMLDCDFLNTFSAFRFLMTPEQNEEYEALVKKTVNNIRAGRLPAAIAGVPENGAAGAGEEEPADLPEVDQFFV